MHRIAAGDRIAVEQVVIKAGQRRQFAAGGCAGQAPKLQICALGEHVRSGHRMELGCSCQAYETAEVLQIAQVRSPGAHVVDLANRLTAAGTSASV